MEKAKAAAARHVRVLEARIEKQRALLEQAKASGEDSQEHIRRLKLLQVALDGMLMHFGQLTPSAEEITHAKKTAPLPRGRRTKSRSAT